MVVAAVGVPARRRAYFAGAVWSARSLVAAAYAACVPRMGTALTQPCAGHPGLRSVDGVGHRLAGLAAGSHAGRDAAVLPRVVYDGHRGVVDAAKETDCGGDGAHGMSSWRTRWA